MLKFYQPYTQLAARQTWSLDGVQIGELDNLTSTWVTTHVEVKGNEPIILKKGHNKIVLPSLKIKDVAVIVELAQELLDSCTNVKAKHIYSVTTEAPSIVVFCKEDVSVSHIADLYLLKGTYR